MSRRLTSRLATLAVTVFATAAMLGVSFDAEAQRRLGGGSFGRQSPNVMQQRQATPPARAPQTQQAAPGPNASAARTGAAGAAAGAQRSAASRWFGPIAGIAAGLGLAALLSSMGLGGALAEFMASLLLIALVVFAVVFLVRRLRGAGRQPAYGAAGAAGMARQSSEEPAASLSRRTGMQSSAVHPAVTSTAAAPVDPQQEGAWYIPAGFDSQQFLTNAKQQFVALQDAWDKLDRARMREYMTDDLMTALEAPLSARTPGGKTDVVLLNAELLGVENVAEGHLASVRFSGMLRDDSGPEAYRFEEVWNFLKPANGGWLLAGIQQIPVEYAS